MRWPLLLHSMATPDSDVVGCLQTAQRLDLDGIELIVDDDYPCAVRLGASPDELARLVHAADDLGLRIAALCPYTRDIDAESQIRRRRAVGELRRCVDLAAELGASSVRVLAGNDRPVSERREAIARAAQALSQAADAAEGTGVSLNVENHMDTLATSAESTRQLVGLSMHPHVGILYDQANLAIMNAESASEAWAPQRRFVRHVHLKNFVPVDGGRRPVGLRAGVVDWRSTLRLLADYTGAMTFEYERRWFPDQLPLPEQVLPRDRDLVLQIAAELDGAGRASSAETSDVVPPPNNPRPPRLP
jgi:sugar phosphate isomerase/epimerase